MFFTDFMVQPPEVLSYRKPPQSDFIWQATPHSMIPSFCEFGAMDTSSVLLEEIRFQT